MAHPRLGIRPYSPEDLDKARFTVAKSVMEPLAEANKRSYYHPLTIAVWAVLSYAFTEFMDWWPSSQNFGGILSLLAPIPALAAVAVPVMFYFDWVNRPYFERGVEKAMSAPDLINIEKTYGKPPSSFDFLEYEGRIIGLIAIDANPNSAQPGRAYIRYYYVADPYRESGVQDDLLNHAIPRLFASPDVTSVEAQYSMLHPYVKKALLARGFKIASSRKNGHYINWEVGTALLTKEKWEQLQQAKSRSTLVSPRK